MDKTSQERQGIKGMSWVEKEKKLDEVSWDLSAHIELKVDNVGGVDAQLLRNELQ